MRSPLLAGPSLSFFKPSGNTFLSAFPTSGAAAPPLTVVSLAEPALFGDRAWDPTAGVLACFCLLIACSPDCEKIIAAINFLSSSQDAQGRQRRLVALGWVHINEHSGHPCWAAPRGCCRARAGSSPPG